MQYTLHILSFNETFFVIFLDFIEICFDLTDKKHWTCFYRRLLPLTCSVDDPKSMANQIGLKMSSTYFITNKYTFRSHNYWFSNSSTSTWQYCFWCLGIVKRIFNWSKLKKIWWRVNIYLIRSFNDIMSTAFFQRSDIVTDLSYPLVTRNTTQSFRNLCL